MNYVEIDLLRGGRRVVPNVPPCEYYAMVVRPAEWPSAGVWPIRLRDRLPAVPVPLRAGEPEPTVDLQAALHVQYDEAMYADFVYRGEPEPRLSAADAEWARSLIAAVE